jgi:hypothetical protein
VLTLQIAAQFPDGDDGGRLAAKLQLNAVIDFLDNLGSAIGSVTSLRDPLFRLLAALDDLESGPTPLMLKGQAKKGRPPPPLVDHIAKAFAAAAMDCLMGPKSGLSREEAAKHVARKIRHWDVSEIGVGKQFSWKTVAFWRDYLSSGSEKEDHGTAVYVALKQEVAKLPPTDAVKALLHSQPWREF